MTMREYRKRAGLTQAQVAERVDVDQTSVSHWEAGRAAPCKKHRERLARLYGVTVEELTGPAQ